MRQTVRAGEKRPRERRAGVVRGLAVALMSLAPYFIGCAAPPHVLLPDEQHVIDRTLVECPAGFDFRRYATGFTAPTAMAFHPDGSLFVAEGERGEEPKIWRIPPNGGRPTLFYPRDKNYIPLHIPNTGWKMYGKIGGMVVVDDEVIVTHRDENDMGVVTALDMKGGHRTLCAGLPAQGDGGLTDIVLDPQSHRRLYFALGSVTNSGVAGLDSVEAGWVHDHPDAKDIPLIDLELRGFKFQTLNPMAGIFGPADIAVTAPFQAFAQSSAIRVRGAVDGKPTGTIYSVSLDGGFPEVVSWGIHDPRGLAFNEYFALYASIDGMDMRRNCTRPIKNDPDSIVMLPIGGKTWLGWPDYSTTFEQVSDPKYQPPEYMAAKSGYPLVRSLIDLDASKLTPPIRSALLQSAFPSLSGANKMTFTPATGPFSNREFGNLIVCLSGDRSPWATGGVALPHRIGFKVVAVRLDTGQVTDMIRNTADMPGSAIDPRNRSLIERPVDPKFGPDGALYVLDEGRMEVRGGHEHFERGTGSIFRVVPKNAGAAAPATAPAQ